MDHYQRRARAFVEQQFPQAEAAFLGGSAGSGKATASSDLDILVLLPDQWSGASFVETSTFEGQLVEAFAYDDRELGVWLARGRGERRPVLDRLIAEGICLIDTPAAHLLANECREVLSAGPAAMTTDERQSRAYSLSAALDDLIDAGDRGERFVLTGTLWREAAELALLVDRCWLGAGKWLLRELRHGADRFGLADWAQSPERDAGTLVACARAVLAGSGGYLQSGFVRGHRPAGL